MNDQSFINITGQGSPVNPADFGVLRAFDGPVPAGRRGPPTPPPGDPPDLRGHGRYSSGACRETEACCEWKIDISRWSPKSPPGSLAPAEELRRRLTPETRPAILWIKDAWHRLPSYSDVVGGMDVYEAVLEHGVRTPEQFGRHLCRRGLPAPWTDACSNTYASKDSSPYGHTEVWQKRRIPGSPHAGRICTPGCNR
jgi:hypothetical protein